MELAQTIALDIDDTLADTAHYFATLLNEKFGNPEKLTPREIIEKYEIIPQVPYWQTPEILLWREQESMSNARQLKVPVMPHAQKVVQKIHKNFSIIYISSRPTIVERGTKQWLDENHFPNGELILRNKEFQVLNGNAWKAQILTEPERNVLAIIDDNPEIISYLRRLYKGAVYLFGTAPVPEFPDIHVHRCKDWHEVELQLEADQLLVT